MKDLDRLYATVKEKYGHIDILFANAGLGNLAPIGQVTEENFDLHFNASAVLFLASNESSYISGIELTVDGGMAQI